MFTISAAVLAFQFLIFITMRTAAIKGTGPLYLAAAAWTVFTIFGGIVTMGLLLFQLVTIGVSLVVLSESAASADFAKTLGSKPPEQVAAAPAIAPVQTTEAKDGGIDRGEVVVLVLLALAWWWFHSSPNVSAPAPPPAVAAAPVSAEPTPPIPASPPNRRVPRTPRGNLQHCLTLTSNAAIARCAEAEQ